MHQLEIQHAKPASPANDCRGNRDLAARGAAGTRREQPFGSMTGSFFIPGQSLRLGVPKRKIWAITVKPWTCKAFQNSGIDDAIPA
jgi:hypothetical protein